MGEVHHALVGDGRVASPGVRRNSGLHGHLAVRVDPGDGELARPGRANVEKVRRGRSMSSTPSPVSTDDSTSPPWAASSTSTRALHATKRWPAFGSTRRPCGPSSPQAGFHVATVASGAF